MTESTCSGARHRWVDSALLVGVLSLLIGCGWRWLHANGYLVRPPFAEAIPYRWKSIAFLQAIERDGLVGWLGEVYARGQDHTPLMAGITGWVAWLRGTGVDPLDIAIVMTSFTLFLLMGTYRLARSFLSHRLAVLATAIVASAPVVTSYQRDFLPSLPMVSLLTWSISSLIREERSPRRFGGLTFGIWCALATLTKVIAPLYLFFPYIAFLWRGRTRCSAKVWTHLLLTTAVWGSVVGPWVATNLGAFLDYTSTQATRHRDVLGLGAPLWSMEPWTYHPFAFLGYGLGFAHAAALSLVTLSTWWRRRDDRGASKVLLVVTVAASWVILTFLVTATQSQYSMVWVPIVTILMMTPLEGGRVSRRLRLTLSVLLLASTCWSLFLAQRGLYEDRTWLEWHGVPIVGPTNHYFGPTYRRVKVLARPEGEPWPVEEFTDLIFADHGSRTSPTLGASHLCLTGNISCQARLRGRTIEVVPMPWEELLKGNLHAMLGMDYVILDTVDMDVEVALELLVARGIPHRILANSRVTSDSEVFLVRFGSRKE